MKARVIRRGGEVLVALPAELGPKLPNDQVDVMERGNEIVISSVRSKPTLEELVAGITEENRHDETDWGPPVGNEVW
jgi:antitoxin MazE